jgi:hypothetical protein
MNPATVIDPRNLLKCDDPDVEAPAPLIYRDYCEANLRTIAEYLGIPAEIIESEPAAMYSRAREDFENHLAMMRRRGFAEMASAFQKWREQIELAAIEKLARRLSAEIEAWIAEKYLQNFRRLPGSSRTARLRKKRTTKLERWYFDEYLPKTLKGAE